MGATTVGSTAVDVVTAGRDCGGDDTGFTQCYK